jgi:glutamate 5-kinase
MGNQRVIIKLGTSTLTAGSSRISAPHIVDIARQISSLHSMGYQVILVSSGAIAAGREALNFPELPKYIPSKQMLAAIGQPRLMYLYTQLFGIYNETVAQVLLIQEDLSDRSRYLNARNTLEALLAHHVIPIINENDTVATNEIRFGDNDNLSAQFASLIEADLLVLLTDQEGLFTGDPRLDSNATLIKMIETPTIPEELWKSAGRSNSGVGTGGMDTKVHAADLARRSGTVVVIANGNESNILLRIVNGESLGTTFQPLTTKLESRKRYLLTVRHASGVLIIDQGAIAALVQGGSLLPVGVLTVTGKFDRGDTVRIHDPSGKEIAIGLVNYPAGDLTHLCRHQSSEIETILGYTFGDEVIHRNNLLIL